VQGSICAGAQHRNTEQNTPQNVHFSKRNIIATSLCFFAHWLRNIPQGPP
jgi:hypothetical protein